MKPKTRTILEMCIEEGIDLGMTRAHKHTQTPMQEHIVNEIMKAIFLKIDEMFSFEDEE